MAPRAQLALVRKDGLVGGGGGEFAELGAGELDEGGRAGGATEALEDGESGEERGRGRGGEIEFHLERDRVADDGGGEVGWEVETKHHERREGLLRRLRFPQ